MDMNFTNLEQRFFRESTLQKMSARIPYIAVDSFPKLGLLSAMSFLEWVTENPTGVVSLPTGKTAQYFIQFVRLLLDNWDEKKGKALREKYGLADVGKVSLSGLQL